VTETLPWHEDDAFWRTFAPWMFHEERWEKTPEQVDKVLELIGLEPPAAVLDLCCGPGRHSLELARRGFRVTGVDRTVEYLEEARRRAGEEDLDIEFVQQDMRRFVRPGAFDVALNLFTSFGYFRDPEDDRTVLRHVHESLKPGGRLLMDLMGREVLARIFTPRQWEERDGLLLLQETNITDDWSWVESRWITIAATERHEFNLSHRLYAGTELRDALLDCGFGEVSLYGGLDGSPYGPEAKRLVASARA
jgi:SAM-dependent methyltransferase